MPTDFLALDTGLAALSGGDDPNKRMDKMTSYLYMLLEQLRWTLANLDAGNFNETGLKEIETRFTTPLYGRIDDAEGRISVLTLNAEALGLRMSDAEGNISTLSYTATLLSSRIGTAEGNISSLTQTATSLTSRIQNAEGSISSLVQTVDSFELSVSNGSSSSRISLTKDGVAVSSHTITFSGVVTFTDLQSNSATVINGDYIKTGTISGRTFRSILSAAGHIGGEIEMCYVDESSVAGGIRLDMLGAGTSQEAKYRMFVYTRTVGGQAFAMKLQSAGAMSLSAGGILHATSSEQISLVTRGGADIHLDAGVDDGTVYLYGKYIYVNGRELETYINSLIDAKIAAHHESCSHSGSSSGGSTGGGTTTYSPSLSASVSGSVITWTLSGARPNTTYSLTLRAYLNGESAGNPETRSITTNSSGTGTTTFTGYASAYTFTLSGTVEGKSVSATV